MNIGDKVRLLRGTEEGKIISIKNNKIVEIEIEDGFVIPALINEVVVIDKREAETFGNDTTTVDTLEKKEERKDLIPEGIHIGFYQSNVDEFEAFIFNQTKTPILFSISQYDKKVIFGKSYGICKHYDHESLGNMTSSIFNEFKKLYIQLIIHESEARLKKQPLAVELSLTREKLKNKIFIHSLDKEISFVSLEDDQTLRIDANELQNRMMETNPLSLEQNAIRTTQAHNTIDLHVDSQSSNLNPNEILEYQLNEFEKAFDNALVMNVEKLKVIHGIGAGILRNEIHKRLSKKSEVKFFEDADKERFGFGSTIIYF